MKHKMDAQHRHTSASRPPPDLNLDIWFNVFNYLSCIELHELASTSKSMRSMVAQFCKHEILKQIPKAIRQDKEGHWLLNSTSTLGDTSVKRERRAHYCSWDDIISPYDNMKTVVDPILQQVLAPISLPMEETRWLFIHAQWGYLFCVECCDIRYTDFWVLNGAFGHYLLNDLEQLRKQAQLGLTHETSADFTAIRRITNLTADCVHHGESCPHRFACQTCDPWLICASRACAHHQVCGDFFGSFCAGGCNNMCCSECLFSYGGYCEFCNEGWICDECALTGRAGCEAVREQVEARLAEELFFSDSDDDDEMSYASSMYSDTSFTSDFGPPSESSAHLYSPLTGSSTGARTFYDDDSNSDTVPDHDTTSTKFKEQTSSYIRLLLRAGTGTPAYDMHATSGSENRTPTYLANESVSSDFDHQIPEYYPSTPDCYLSNIGSDLETPPYDKWVTDSAADSSGTGTPAYDMCATSGSEGRTPIYTASLEFDDEMTDCCASTAGALSAEY